MFCVLCSELELRWVGRFFTIRKLTGLLRRRGTIHWGYLSDREKFVGWRRTSHMLAVTGFVVPIRCYVPRMYLQDGYPTDLVSYHTIARISGPFHCSHWIRISRPALEDPLHGWYNTRLFKPTRNYNKIGRPTHQLQGFWSLRYGVAPT